MNPPVKNINSEMIIETTLQMIDKNEGIKGVTLRAIAQKLGCAHTNLYNYFGSLEEIYWECVGFLLQKMTGEMSREDRGVSDPEEKLYMSLSRLMDFSFDHPGWHRLIWLEPAAGSPSPEVAHTLQQPALVFGRLVFAASKGTLPDDKLSQLCSILLCYLYGEINMWITRRNSAEDRALMKTKTLANLQLLYRLISEDSRKII
ncbi:MAG: TetR/AcrR family transcriptional regulator [Eubacteriales bacterium]